MHVLGFLGLSVTAIGVLFKMVTLARGSCPINGRNDHPCSKLCSGLLL